MSDNGDQSSIIVRRRPKSSTTLNRRYVKRPTRKSGSEVAVSIKKTSKINHFNTPSVAPKTTPEKETIPIEIHPLQTSANAKMKARTATPVVKKVTAKELKDEAIRKALASASSTGTMGQAITTADAKKSAKKTGKIRFGAGRIMLALFCAAAAVFALVYFVNLNMPDISFRVAAMQTGINATYPSYVPRGFNVSNIASEDGKIAIGFKNSETGDAFSLTEEKSSWDSNALLSNYVKPTYSDNYTIVREQGLTIYISGSNAAWVNGGIVYKLEAITGSLTNKQIRSIAVSL